MSSQKNEFRLQLKQARLELTDAERTLKSRAIVANLKEVINWKQARTLHYFESIHELLEPDISEFITYLEDNSPDLKLFTPRLIDNTWQLISAKGGKLPEVFDVVIVPMLGFDDKLNRIGYGGGYYDKFLATQSSAKKIGICFEAGHIKELPVDSHDVAMDTIVSESKAYST